MPLEKKTGDHQRMMILLSAMAGGLTVLIILIIFIYRRVKLFSRATANMKGTEEDGHE